MTLSGSPDIDTANGDKTLKRRRYHSPLREQQAAQTRQKLIMAGVGLVQELSNWEWKHLTFKAVSERAGVSERTVYRHFASERQLRDAVMEELVTASGIDLARLELNSFGEATQKIFAMLSTFSLTPATVKDPTLASMDQKRREALLSAVQRATPAWSAEEVETVAAGLDILWDVPSFERLIAAWKFDPARAARTIQWMVRLVEESVQRGEKP